MVFRSSLIILLAVAGIFLKSYTPSPADPQKKEFFTLQAVIKFLDRVHYNPKDMNDQLSEQIFKNYLDALDPAKRFLTQEEVEQLTQFKLELDDQISNGSFAFLDLSVDLIAHAIVKAESYYLERLDEDFSIHTDEYLVLNGDKRGYAADDEGLRNYWRKLIQYETIVKVHDMQKAEMEDEEKKSEAELIAKAKDKVRENFGEWFKRLKSLRRSDRFEDYLNGITAAYDPHSNYFSPKDKQDFDLNMNGSYEGIGARLIPEGEFTKVSQVIPGGPAWKQKELEENDFIIGVKQEGEESKDVRGWRQDDVIVLIRGKKGTRVTLTVRKPDGTVKDIAIIRDQVVLEEGKASSLVLSAEEEGPDIGYIRLPKFYFEADGKPGCAEDVSSEIKKLQTEGVKGIILDLRNNGGGSLAEVVDMSGLFFDEGPVVQVKSRGRKPYVLKDEDPEVHYQGPLVVMVNHFSASASEIIAAVLQDYDRAVIVGSNSTFGKGTVQRFHELDRFIVGNNDLKPLGEIKITTQKFYRVNGGSTQLRGVVPDIVLPSPYNYIKVGEKEYDRPLAWSEIEPVRYDKNTSAIKNKEELIAASAERVSQHPTFALVDERAHMLEDQEESEMRYPLDLDGYQDELERRKAKNARFKDMFEPIEGLSVRNVEADVARIDEDERRKANNDDFIKGVKKDIYIEEALNIVRDMINRP